MKKTTGYVIGMLIGAGLSFSACAAELKVGFVDLQHILQTSPKAAQIGNQLKTQMATDKSKIDAKQKNLDNLTTKMKRDAAVMQEDDKAKLQKQIDDATDELNGLKESFNEKMFTAQQQAMVTFMQQITNVVAKIAKTNHLDLVVPKETLLYADESFNITSQVENAL